ncbi:MAG: tail fiber domain-containing protein, partial [Bacteroidota bacterium]
GEVFRTDGPSTYLNTWRLRTGGQTGGPAATEKGMIFNYGNNPVVPDQANFSVQATEKDLTFHTGASDASGVAQERMRIMANGHVGIGTDNPISMLHIKSNYGNCNIVLESLSGFQWDMSAVNTGPLTIYNVASATNAMTILNTNNFVGINNNTPQNRLHINENDNTFLYAQWTNVNTGTIATDGFLVGIDEVGTAIFDQQEDLPMLFQTYSPPAGNSVERIRVTTGINSINNNEQTRVALSLTGNPITNPVALLHLGENLPGGSGAGSRSWMNNGMFIYEDTDNMYVGLISTTQQDRKDAIINWGDNWFPGSGIGAGPEALRFIFTSPGSGNLQSSDQYGDEIARMTYRNGVPRMGICEPVPLARLHVTSHHNTIPIGTPGEDNYLQLRISYGAGRHSDFRTTDEGNLQINPHKDQFVQPNPNPVIIPKNVGINLRPWLDEPLAKLEVLDDTWQSQLRLTWDYSVIYADFTTSDIGNLYINPVNGNVSKNAAINLNPQTQPPLGKLEIMEDNWTPQLRLTWSYNDDIHTDFTATDAGDMLINPINDGNTRMVGVNNTQTDLPLRADIDVNGMACVRELPLPANEDIVAFGTNLDKIVAVNDDGVLYWRDISSGSGDLDWEHLPPTGVFSGHTNSGGYNEGGVYVGIDQATVLTLPIQTKFAVDYSGNPAFTNGAITGLFHNTFPHTVLSPNSIAYGVYSSATGTAPPESGINIGGFFSARNAGYNYGVYGKAPISNDNYAGLFQGNVRINGLAFCTYSMWSSDSTIKKDVSEISNALEIISFLKPSTYTYKYDEYPFLNLPEGVQYGLISQDIEPIIPELVHEYNVPPEIDTSGNAIEHNMTIKALNYIGLIPILTQGIIELSDITDSLGNEINKPDSDWEKTNNGIVSGHDNNHGYNSRHVMVGTDINDLPFYPVYSKFTAYEYLGEDKASATGF